MNDQLALWKTRCLKVWTWVGITVLASIILAVGLSVAGFLAGMMMAAGGAQ